MEDITKKFIRFLKEHGMYIEYTQEFARQKDDRIRWSGSYDTFKKKINGSIDDFCTNLMNASDILSYSFKGYEFSDEHKENECSALDNDIFKDVEMFEISGFNEIAIFQALFFDIGLIEKNISNIFKNSEFCSTKKIFFKFKSIFIFYKRKSSIPNINIRKTNFIFK